MKGRKMAQNRKPRADTQIHQDNAAGAIFQGQKGHSNGGTALIS